MFPQRPADNINESALHAFEFQQVWNSGAAQTKCLIEIMLCRSIAIEKNYVARQQWRAQEEFVSLLAHAHVDIGSTLSVISSAERKVHFFSFELPHSNACFFDG